MKITKYIFLLATVSFFTIAVASSVVTATSGWHSSLGDAREDCNARLEAQGGNTSGEVRYESEEGEDGMGNMQYRVTCRAYAE